MRLTNGERNLSDLLRTRVSCLSVSILISTSISSIDCGKSSASEESITAKTSPIAIVSPSSYFNSIIFPA